MSTRDDLRAAVERLADEFHGATLGTDFFGNPLGGWVPVARLRTLLAERPAPEPPSGYAVPAGHHDPLRPGTLVLAWPGSRESSPLVTRTRSEVWAVASGDRVVMVEGYAGGIALTHIDVLPEPPSGGEVTAEENTAAYWRDRFRRMQAMYRERFNEGLSAEDWHRKHCGLMSAPEVTADKLAKVIWTTSRADESTISATGANHVAAAILARYDVRRRP